MKAKAMNPRSLASALFFASRSSNPDFRKTKPTNPHKWLTTGRIKYQGLRIFANVAPGIERVPDDWRRFKSEEKRDAAETGDNLNENAYVWTKDGKIIGANFTFQSPSRD